MSPTATSAAQRFLSELERNDLAALLSGGVYEFATDDDGFMPQVVVELRLAGVCADSVRALSQDDARRIVEAIRGTDPEAAELGLDNDGLNVRHDDSISVSPQVALLAELLLQRSVMIAVATNEARLNTVDDYFKARRRRLQSGLGERGLTDPVPFDSLWDWYHYWQQHFSSYRERRAYVRELFKDVIAAVIGTPVAATPHREPTGWARVDRTLLKARNRVAECRNEEDWQGIGLLCREALISLAQAVYDPSKHRTVDGVAPSTTDAKRMLEAFIATELGGDNHEAVRRHARASLALASDLVHTRTADQRRALLCLEATQSSATVIAILSNRTSGLDARGSQAVAGEDKTSLRHRI